MKNNNSKNNYKNKSKKLKKNIKTRRYYGGAITNPQDILNSIENKSNEVRSKNSVPNFGGIIFGKVFKLLEGLLVEYINKIALLLGVDISNPQQVNEKLEKIKIILSDPEIREKVKIIVERIVIIMEIAIEAAEPYAKPLAKKMAKIYVDMEGEFGGTTVKIARDVIQTIPGLNVIASLLDLSSNASKYILDTYNAKLQLQNAIANTVEASSINYSNLLKEKKELLDRTKESVNQFNQQNQNQENQQN